MNIRKYTREVIEYVREIGGSDFEIVSGGRHLKLAFVFGGIKKVVTLSPNSPNAVQVKIRDIKKYLNIPNLLTKDVLNPFAGNGHDKTVDMLGSTSSIAMVSASFSNTMFNPKEEEAMNVEPVVNLPEVRRNEPEEAEVMAKTEITGNCSVAYYKNNGQRIHIRFGHGVLTGFDTSRKLELVSNTQESWEFRVNDSGTISFRKEYFDSYVLNFILPGMDFFKAKPAEFMIIDGQIVINLLQQPKQPEEATMSIAQPITEPVTQAHYEMPAPAPMQRVSALDQLSDFTEAELRAVLARIRHIETNSPFRLVRAQDGDVAFEAVIR